MKSSELNSTNFLWLEKIFSLLPPNFSTKKKTVNQPVLITRFSRTANVIGSFLVLKLGGKRTPRIYIFLADYLQNRQY